MHITPLTQSSVPAYRALMLEAYELAADAFSTSLEERRAESDEWWIKRVGSPGGLIESFGAWSDGELVGALAIEYSPKVKVKHVALLIGMYVKPSYRSSGIGRALMNATMESAAKRPEVTMLTLTLTEGNEPALRLYESVGFTVWGIEPLALRTSGGFKGKVYMSKPLPPPHVAA